MDAITKLVWDSEFSVACLGRVQSDNTVAYMLAPLDCKGHPLSEEQTDLARLRGYSFAGVFGYRDGVADCLPEPGEQSWRVMVKATPEFLTLLAARLAPKGDAVSWLERLAQLPDDRPESPESLA